MVVPSFLHLMEQPLASLLRPQIRIRLWQRVSRQIVLLTRVLCLSLTVVSFLFQVAAVVAPSVFFNHPTIVLLPQQVWLDMREVFFFLTVVSFLFQEVRRTLVSSTQQPMLLPQALQLQILLEVCYFLTGVFFLFQTARQHLVFILQTQLQARILQDLQHLDILGV